jgi:type II secretory pathway component PulC
MAQIKEFKMFLEEMFAPIFLSERSRYAGLFALILAGILLCWALVSTVTTWYGDLQTPKLPTAAAQVASNAEAQLITQIPSQHIFGQASNDDFLPLTSLQMRLTGILKDANDGKSKVIVAEGEEPGKVYGVGDSVVSGIIINAINDDGIVLERNGHLEKLPLTRPQLSFQDAPQTLWVNN